MDQPPAPSSGAELVLQPTDVFFTRGTSLLSKAIRFFTQSIGESRTKINHVGIVVEGGAIDQAFVVEALSRVRRHRLWKHYAGRRRTKVAVYRPTNLAPEDGQLIVTKAESYVGAKYGRWMIIAHLLDWLLQGAYVFRRLIGSNDYPICSWVVAHAYKAAGRHFGTKPGAASPDDIWDFIVEDQPELYRQIHPLKSFQEAPMEKDRSKRWAYAALAAAIAVGIPVAGLMPDRIQTRLILMAGLIIAFLVLVARLQTGTVLGLLVDERNKTSSSRLQLVGWTILILSAYAVAALWNVSLGASDPLGIGIPPAIWAALGISITSFVGSPVIKKGSNERGQTLEVNTEVTAARASDVLMAEGEGAANSLDLGKVQMLLFTLILLVAYGAALHGLLTTQAALGLPIQDFPSVGGGMLALLGLSHSGYLVYKAAPKPGGDS